MAGTLEAVAVAVAMAVAMAVASAPLNSHSRKMAPYPLPLQRFHVSRELIDGRVCSLVQLLHMVQPRIMVRFERIAAARSHRHLVHGKDSRQEQMMYQCELTVGVGGTLGAQRAP